MEITGNWSAAMEFDVHDALIVLHCSLEGHYPRLKATDLGACLTLPGI